MAVRTGEQFLQGLRDGREVWLEGERVEDVTAHPKLTRMAHTLADIYDLQHSPELRERMTFASPTSGDPVALSYLVPQNNEDLLRRRAALEIVAQSCHGMLGRTPDYVNIQLTASRQLAALYGEKDSRYADNLRAYHEYVREKDLCLTHAFGHPQVNRSVALAELPNPYVAVGVVDICAEGVVVRGAKNLATLAPFSDEIFAPLYRPLREGVEEDRKYCLGFAVPSNIKGLKYICRPSHDLGLPLADYPLSGQFDEIDSLVVFDDVVVPWERVFLYDDVELGNRTVNQVALWRHYMQQVAVKNIAKLEFILGIVQGITEGIGIGVYGHVQEKTAEIIDTIETYRAYMRAAEAGGRGGRRAARRGGGDMARAGAVDCHAALVPRRLPTGGGHRATTGSQRADADAHGSRCDGATGGRHCQVLPGNQHGGTGAGAAVQAGVGPDRHAVRVAADAV